MAIITGGKWSMTRKELFALLRGFNKSGVDFTTIAIVGTELTVEINESSDPGPTFRVVDLTGKSLYLTKDYPDNGNRD